MSKFNYCITINGEKICIDIPVIHEPWLLLKNLLEVRPTPDPWIIRDKVIPISLYTNQSIPNESVK